MKTEELFSIAMSIGSLLERSFQVAVTPLIYRPTNPKYKPLEGYVVEAKHDGELATVVVMPDSITVRTPNNRSTTVQYHDPNMYDIITEKVCRGVPRKSYDTSVSGMGLYA